MITDIVQMKPFEAMCRSVDAKPREYQAHLLPWLKHPVKSYSGGLMLVGDAAGFPCPLEAEGIWHAVTSGIIAARTAEWALGGAGDVSESALAEYERRWKASDLGKEHEFGPEYVDLWDSSIFDPKLMTKQIQLLLEFSMLHPFSIVFDWGDAHMDCLNHHIEHFLDLAPEFGEFGATYIKPMARGIWPRNVKRVLLQVKPRIPALRRLSDENYFRVLRRLSKALAPYLDPEARQDEPLPRSTK